MAGYLVTGAKGRVGGYLVSAMQARGMKVIGWERKHCDLGDHRALERQLSAIEVDCVINCAAVSGIESSLDNPVTAHLVNAVAPQILARVCAREGRKLIHLSTDYVLDGGRPGLKDETAKRKPVNIYAASKEEGEWRVLDEHPAALVARVSWVFGNPSRPSFAESILRRAIQGESLSAIDDKYSMPTWVDDLSGWLIRLSQEERMPEGVIHLCQSGQPVSWYEYADEVLVAASEAGFDLKNKRIEQQKLDEQPGFRDLRPRHTAMDNSRLTTYLGQQPRSWQQSLGLYLTQLAAQRSL